MNDGQLGISLKVEVDKLLSTQEIQRFLSDVENKNTLGIKLDTQEIAKQIKELSNVNMSFNHDGSLKNMTSQIKSETGDILKLKAEANEQGELEIKNLKLTNNSLKQQQELEKIKIKHLQSQRELALQISKLLNGKNAQYLTSQDLAKIQNMEKSFRELNATSMSELNNSLKDAKISMNEISSSANIKRINDTAAGVDNLGQKLKDLGLYISGAMIIRQLWAAFKEGVEYIKELDEAYTDVAISMDITREEFNEWTKDARKIAQTNGQMTTSLMQMVKIYAQAGESITDIQEKLAGTAMIQNITQWDAEQTTSAVNSILNQYNLMNKEINGVTGDMSNAIQYIGDNLIGISNALSIDNVKGIQEMVHAVDDAGSVIHNAGGSLEWFMGVTGALAEATNSTGSEIGATMRMVTARTLRQGEAISELEAQGEDLEFAMAKAERALEGIGVTIRGETADELRDIEEIIGDVADAWDTLSDSQKQAVSEGMAGTQRSSMFSALIENYDRVRLLQQEGLKSNGELFEANQIRVESLEGQLNILHDKTLAFMDSFQPIIYGSVELGNSLLDLVNGFGAIPTVVGLASASFLTFNESGQRVKNTLMEMAGSKLKVVDGINQVISAQNNAVEIAKNEVAITQQQISSTVEKIAKLRLEHSAQKDRTVAIQKEQQALVGLNKELVNHQKQLALSTLKATAFQAVLNLGTSLAISGTLWALGKLTQSLKDMTPSLEKLKEKISDTSNAMVDYKTSLDKMASAKEDIGKINGMLDKIEKEKLVQEEQNDLLEEAEQLLAQHGNSYTSIKAILENENIPLKERVELLEQEAKLEAERSAREAFQSIASADMWGNSSFQLTKNSLENEQVEIARIIRNMNSEINTLFGSEEAVAKKTKQIKDKYMVQLNDHKLNLEDFVSQANINYNSLLEAFDLGIVDETQFKFYKQQYKDTIKQLEKWCETNGVEVNIIDLTKTSNKTKDSVSQLSNELKDEIEKLGENLTVDMDSEQVGISLSGLSKKLEKIEEGSDEAKQTLEKLHSTFKDMPEDVDTLAEAVDFLNGKFKETAESESMKDLNEAYLEALENVEEAQDLIDSFADGLDTSELRSIFDSELMEDYNGSLTNTASMLDHITSKLQEFKDQSYEASVAMVLNNEDAWNSITEDMANSLNVQEQGFQEFINSLGGMRQVDIQNASNAADAQLKAEMNLVGQGAKYYAGFVNSKASNRQTDMENVEAFLNSQGVAEAKTVEELAKLWAEYYKAKKAEIGDTIDKMAGDYGDLGSVDPELMKKFHDLQRLNNTMTNYFSNINTNFGGVGSDLKQTLANTSSSLSNATKPSSSSSGSGNKGSSSSSKEVADLEFEIDRYHELNDALVDVQNAIKKNQALQKTASAKEKIKLLEEEIDLYQQQQKAIQAIWKEQQKEVTKQLQKIYKTL